MDGWEGAAVCFEVNNLAVGLLREFFWKLASKAFFQFWLLWLADDEVSAVKNGGVLGKCSPEADVWFGIVESSFTIPVRGNILIPVELPILTGARYNKVESVKKCSYLMFV